MAKLAPVHRDAGNLTEVQQADQKEIRKHFHQSIFILDPKSADHIAANIYLRNRNFSFRAAVTMLRSTSVDFYTHSKYPTGYVAVGIPEPSGEPEDRYIRKGRVTVIFELRYNRSTNRKVVDIVTGWSEFDLIDLH